MIHNDHLGTPQKMTDSSGTVVWAADYKPFGEATITVSTITNNLRFPGQYIDAETGLNYNSYRDYNPVIGRYIEADPFGLDGGQNHLFVYTSNNPLGLVDPNGYFGYKNPKVPPAQGFLLALLNCIESKYGSSFTVNSTTDSHPPGDPHTKGRAADIAYPNDPGKFLCAASLCGATMAIDEMIHPSPKSTGPHIHVQIGCGKGAPGTCWRGDLPEPDKCKKKCGQ